MIATSTLCSRDCCPAGGLRAHGIALEPSAPPETVERLTIELDRMATWLGLAWVSVGEMVRTS